MFRIVLRPAAAAVAAGFCSGALAALDVAGLDRSVSPCTDFYRHVNGKWMASTAIPDDRTSWGTGSIVDKANEAILVAALDQAMKKRPAPGTGKRKAVDYYASGMDVESVERAGLAPLDDVMKRIDGVDGAAGLARTLGYLHARGIGAGFSWSVDADAKDSTRYLLQVSQGGLGLPDRDYYFKDDERSRQQRDAYVKHVARMLELAGSASDRAARDAATIFEMEKELAAASMTVAERRDDEKTYNKRTVAGLQAEAPAFPWEDYLEALGAGHAKELNVSQPEFFKRLARLARERPVADWRTYLRWHVLHDTANTLPRRFVDESFAFYETTLRGRKAQPPRHRHVLAVVSGPYGTLPMAHAVGEIFVERAFPPEAKARALAMVDNIKAALGERLRAVDWMGQETRAKALEKLSTFQVKIGYPDRPRDYSDADLGSHPFAENWMRANLYETRRDMRRIGQPIDRVEWLMSPHMVNAYYEASRNEIVFPAGILQPPFFDAKADDALNYGGIGTVIGHEITHGFDDRGRKYDARGNLKDWWTEADARRYTERAQRMVKQYSGFKGVDGLHVKGEVTLGENISDLGGLKIAYLGLQKALADKPRPLIDGLTPEQRFFISYAIVWRNLMRPEQERLRLLTGVHSPPRYRVMGPIAHMPEFAQAFSCDAGKTLLSESERANIW